MVMIMNDYNDDGDNGDDDDDDDADENDDDIKIFFHPFPTGCPQWKEDK